MRLRAKEAVPDHYRRAARLAAAVLLLASLGFSLIGTGHDGAVMLAKWASLTAPVVTMPLLGKTSQVGFERVLGTLVGGLLGYLATALATRWWTLQATETDDIFLAVMASAGAALSVLAGKRWNLDLSARLFVVAFLLVAFSSQQGDDPRQVAATRVGGIALGVLTMMLLSILVLPKSASVETLRTLRKALEKLQEVNATAWGPHLAPPDKQPGGQDQPHAEQHQQPQPAAPAAATKADAAAASGGRAGRAPAPGDSAALLEPLLPPAADGADLEAGGHQVAWHGVAAEEGAAADGVRREADAEEENLLKSEKALTELYQLLDKVGEHVSLAKNEYWIATLRGHPVVLPGLWPRRQSDHLPWRELEAMANAIRRVARLLNTALTALQGGFERQLREVLGPLYPDGLLPALAAGAGAALQELHAAFPNEPSAGSAGLAAFSAGVLSLVDVSDQQRRQVVRAMRRYRNRTAARKSWARLIDAALLQQQQAAAGGAAGAEAGAGGSEEGSPEAFATPEGGTSPSRSLAELAEASAAPPGAAAAAAGADGAGPAGAAGGDSLPPVQKEKEAPAGGWLARVSGGMLGGAAAAGAAEVSPVRSASQRHLHRRGLSAALDSPPLLAAVEGQGGAGGADGQEGQGGAGGAGGQEGQAPLPLHPPAGEASPARPSSAASAAAPPPQLLSRAAALRSPGSSLAHAAGSLALPLAWFPDTVEGRLAQGVCEELAEQLAGLHAAVNTVLRRLPA